jgi:hypothetical protein
MRCKNNTKVVQVVYDKNREPWEIGPGEVQEFDLNNFDEAYLASCDCLDCDGLAKRPKRRSWRSAKQMSEVVREKKIASTETKREAGVSIKT